MAEEVTTGFEPTYDTGSVNVDSLKEILNQLGNSFPFQDETSKVAFHAQVNSLESAGDPHAEPETTTVESDEVTALRAKIAEMEAEKATASQGGNP